MDKLNPHDFICRKVRGGKKSLWNAWLMPANRDEVETLLATLPYGWERACGAANTADNAIKDCRKQLRLMVK